MIDWLFAIFIFIGVLLWILAIETKESCFWCFINLLFGTLVWFILSASIFEIEIPYTLFNVTSGNIESMTTIFTSKVAPEIMYFFMGLGFVTMILSIIVVFYAICEELEKRGIIKRIH